jgi:hypothetical protein
MPQTCRPVDCTSWGIGFYISYRFLQLRRRLGSLFLMEPRPAALKDASYDTEKHDAPVQHKARESICAAGERVCDAIESWRHVGTTYLFGCEFSGRLDRLDDVRSAIEQLLTRANSPWNTDALPGMSTR